MKGALREVGVQLGGAPGGQEVSLQGQSDGEGLGSNEKEFRGDESLFAREDGDHSV